MRVHPPPQVAAYSGCEIRGLGRAKRRVAGSVHQRSYDVIIVGLGAMGSAAAYHLARNGSGVLGFDRFTPPHTLGSSHGSTRIIREAYFEHPLYVPLVRRAYELWTELEGTTGRRLLLPTGGLMLGPPDGVLVSGARLSAERHQLAHEVLTPAQLRARFPLFNPGEGMVAVWEPRAGVLFPELAVQTHLEMASRHGARLRFNEAVLSWKPEGGGVHVLTAAGDYRASKLLLSAGAWVSPLLAGLQLPLTVERQVQCWFKPQALELKQGPIFLCEYALRRFFYGFPDLGEGVKAAVHHQGEVTQPDDARREVSSAEAEVVRVLLARFLPAAAGPLRSAVTCLYTNTPDEHFVLGQHPHHPQVLIASPCSGHGFKFSPVIGEIACTWLRGGVPAFDLSLFRADRFLETPKTKNQTP